MKPAQPRSESLELPAPCCSWTLTAVSFLFCMCIVIKYQILNPKLLCIILHIMQLTAIQLFFF